jgi:hypothetical protein
MDLMISNCKNFFCVLREIRSSTLNFSAYPVSTLSSKTTMRFSRKPGVFCRQQMRLPETSITYPSFVMLENHMTTIQLEAGTWRGFKVKW